MLPGALSACGQVASNGIAGATETAASFTVGGQLNGVAAVSGTRAWGVGTTGRGNPLALNWNGRTWRKQLPLPRFDRLTSPGGGYLNGVAAVSGRDAWAVGAGPYNRALIEHWNGTRWKIVRGPVSADDSILHGAAAMSAADAWAVGENRGKTLIEHWNGRVWSQLPSPAPAGYGSILNGVAAISATNAWAVGLTYLHSGGTATLIEHWNGTSWSLVPSPTPRGGGLLAGVAALSPANAWAVGSSTQRGALIEHWNGVAWTITRPPAASRFSALSGVAVTSAGNAWAVGSTVSLGKIASLQSLIVHWNGSAWTVVASPAHGMLTGVTATSASNAWAVGFSTGSGNAFIEHWNGTRWT